jgi:hypothetical protein
MNERGKPFSAASINSMLLKSKFGSALGVLQR